MARNEAQIVRSPSTETGYAIRRSSEIAKLESDQHLLGKKTRDNVIKELIDRYGDIETINRLIEKEKQQKSS